MKTFGMSHALLSLVYAHNNTTWCYCGRYNVKEYRWKHKKYTSRRTRCACLWEARKRMRKCPSTISLVFFYSFQCTTCYQRLRDGRWATAATSAPKACKKKWRVRPRCCTSGCRRQNPKILCCGTKQNYHYCTWKKWILPGITMKNLLSMARGSYTRVKCLMSPAKVRSGPSLSFRCS